MIAKFDYKALGKQTSSGDVDISFKKNDRMRIVSFLPNNEHWLKVELSSPSNPNAKVCFPFSIIEKLN